MEQGAAVTGHPATIAKLEEGALRMQEVGHNQVRALQGYWPQKKTETSDVAPGVK